MNVENMMTSKDEALKMVINWFEGGDFYYPEELLNACKEALEQPAQEPLTRAQQVIRANNTAQPTQEPVATVAVDNFGNICVGWIKNPNHNDKLYTHPHQWQGLTDNEIQELTHDGVADEYDIKFARAVLAKAKEKNYYGPT